MKRKVFVKSKIIRNRQYWILWSKEDECNYAYDAETHSLYEAKVAYINDHGYDSFELFEFVPKYDI